ncbi:MAG: choline/carnitine O-acyltransferase [Caldilineales bacterium]|nr:choline/carnitine O-acyltransferase [Caldilineales bacterium]
MPEQPIRLFNRNFFLQWQGQTVSRLGSQVFAIAMVFWIKRATGSASVMGLMSLVAGLPAILLMPIGGALADRFHRKTIIVLSDFLRGVAVTALAALIFLQPDSTGLILAGLFAVAVFSGLVNAIFSPAIGATIPDLVPRDKVTAANALGQLSIQASVFVGQGLGGVLFRLLGAPVLFLLNGLSFFYASFSELFVQIPQTLPERKGDWRSQVRAFRADLAEGLRYVWRRPGLRELVLMSAAIGFFTAPLAILLPFYVEDFLRAKPDWYGFILAAFGVGTLIGYAAAGVVQLTPRGRSRTIVVLTLVAATAYGLLGVFVRPLAALALAALGGFAAGFITVNITTLVQVTTPSDIRGRVVGLLAALSTSLTPIAMGLAGVVADLTGQNIPMIYLASGAIMAALALLLSSGRAYRGILATDYVAEAARLSGPPPVTPLATPVHPATPGGLPMAAAPAGNPGHARTGADPDLRTLDVYEQLPHYPKPPLVPLPRPEDLDEVLTELGQPRGSLARRITDLTFGMTRFRPWLKQLPEQVEALQRRHNLRLPGLETPVISATLALADDPRPLSPLARAATLILGVRSFYRDLMSGALPPDTFRGQPLEMGQYPNFFSTSQVIEGGVVRLYKSRHVSTINVIVGGRFYLLDIGEPGAEPTVAGLEAALAEIVRRAREEPLGPEERSPGVLTCAYGPTQRRAFAQLQQNPANRESLRALRHTFFTLCLDLDDHPATLEEAALIGQSRNQDNRWFHASFQLVVFGNARACAICNFTAYLDGNVMMRGAAEIQRRAAGVTAEAVTTKEDAPLSSGGFSRPVTDEAVTTTEDAPLGSGGFSRPETAEAVTTNEDAPLSSGGFSRPETAACPGVQAREAVTTKENAPLSSGGFSRPVTAEAVTTKIRRLQWQVPEPLLAEARRDLETMLDRTGQPVTFEIPGYGRQFFAEHGVEAVPTFILALQMTANRLAGRPARITQFLSMSRYRCTDLATTVVSGPQVQQFAQAMLGEAAAGQGNGATAARPGGGAGEAATSRGEDLQALLHAAIAEQAQIARQARRYLPLPIILNLFLRSRRGAGRRWTELLLWLRMIALRKLGVAPLQEREVLVSHPEIYPEVPIVGRPGVRLPYVKYFGLHYQIMADKIVITMMPGVRWPVPNTRLIEELTDSLHRIRQVLEEGKPA